jgi:peptidoglycan L-alanyl-D-glutamate endopeptidase CwlK
LSWVVDKNWKIVAECFKKRGFSWGGDWKSFKDYPHVEKTFGFHWKQLLTLHNKKQFIPGETYINLVA